MTARQAICAILSMLSLVLSFETYAQMTTDEAFADGLLFGKESTSGKVNFSHATAGDRIFGYTGSVPDSSSGIDAAGLHGGGSGDLFAPAAVSNAECLSMVDHHDKAKQQACNAVKSMNSFYSPYTFGKDDPLFKRVESAQADPLGTLESFGGAGLDFNLSESGCVLETSIIAAPLVDKVCHEYADVISESCTLDRVVVVDTDYFYRCDQSDCTVKIEVCSRSTVIGECTYGSIPIVEGITIESEWWCDVCDYDNRYGDYGTPFTKIAEDAGNTVTFVKNVVYIELLDEYRNEYVWTAEGGGAVAVGLNGIGNIGSGHVFKYHPDGEFGRISIDGAIGIKRQKPWMYFSNSTTRTCSDPILVRGTKDYPSHYICPSSDSISCPEGSTMQVINGNETCAGNMTCEFSCNSTCTAFSSETSSVTSGFCK